MKKQVKKLSKKILIYGLATSIIFTSCFSYKKMEVKAMGAVVAALSAATLYDICLYVGGIAVTALGVGYVYENRDEIAEFGKSVIDTMSDVNTLGWILGSIGREAAYVYGGEVFQAVKDNAWDYIKDGGSYSHIGQDLTGDGVIDIADREFEIASSNYWTTAEGAEYIYSQVQNIYDSWVNKEEDNILDAQYGTVDGFFNGYKINEAGYYVGSFRYIKNGVIKSDYLVTSYPVAVFIVKDNANSFTLLITGKNGCNFLQGSSVYTTVEYSDSTFSLSTDLPVIVSNDYELKNSFVSSAKDNISVVNEHNSNVSKIYRVADWIDAEGAWMDTLDEISITLRSLQDICDIATQACSLALELAPTVAGYKDLVADLADTFPVCLDTVANPVYWPETNTAPKIDAADLPNAEVANPDIPVPDNPGDEDSDDPEIVLDTNGLLGLFNILLYIIMIIIMLIYLFLACLAFIVMIFRIPASSAMLPEEMVMGFEHLKTIMIPGMNISIYGFAMALIYMFIIFAVIRALRLEINHFRIPRSYK